MDYSLEPISQFSCRFLNQCTNRQTDYYYKSICNKRSHILCKTNYEGLADYKAVNQRFNKFNSNAPLNTEIILFIYSYIFFPIFITDAGITGFSKFSQRPNA